MSESVARIMTLARHEFRFAFRSRILAALIAVLIVVTVVSVYISATDYRGQLADYEAYINAAKAGGVQRIGPSPLALLSLLRGAMEYIEIIGAVIAIALGYLSVSRERASRTMSLIRSRPVTPTELATGNALGAFALITTLVAVSAAVGVICLGLVGNDWIDKAQAVKLLLAYLASVIYMFVFYCLAFVCTVRSKAVGNGLMLALSIWLIVVLILPQIGDTLDADNQLPGGLFSALAVSKPQEDAILSHFGTYEFVRTGIEELSFAKHYERFAFAMTDVKAKDRDLSLSQLLAVKQHDIEWTAFYLATVGGAMLTSLRRRPTSRRRRRRSNLQTQPRNSL